MKKVNFRDWTVEKVEDAFGLEQTFNHPLLKQLVSFQYEVSEFEAKTLLKFQQNYEQFGGEDWNEVELASKFISPLIVFSDMDNRKFGYFLERDLSTTIGDYELVGKVDGIIATGFRSPKKPYFCLNEYKKESDPNGDPRGQLLIAMLVAQELNQDGKPIYGLYIVGKYWRFVVLTGKNYAFGKSLVADQEDIFNIYKALKSLRHAIEEMIKIP
ncbi:MAG: hypothetical protein RLZZ628_194 [Bacteroidota bacterium]|jgi:hypothetical protein